MTDISRKATRKGWPKTIYGVVWAESREVVKGKSLSYLSELPGYGEAKDYSGLQLNEAVIMFGISGRSLQKEVEAMKKRAEELNNELMVFSDTFGISKSPQNTFWFNPLNIK